MDAIEVSKILVACYFRQLPLLIAHRVQPNTHGKVKEWRLRDKEHFTGCAISPEAALVAYWTDTKIFLYTSQSLGSGESNLVSPAAGPYSLPASNCIWTSVCLTSKYIVASTTGASHHVRITLRVLICRVPPLASDVVPNVIVAVLYFRSRSWKFS
jgi:hypothetical protein